jgi:septum site-determining protein MinC
MISIKGLRQGLLIVFSNENEPWLSKLRELEAKLNANDAFFRGGNVAFDLGTLSISAADLRRANDLLTQREVKLFCVLSKDDNTLAAATELGLQTTLPTVRARESKRVAEAAPAVAAQQPAVAADTSLSADVAALAESTPARVAETVDIDAKTIVATSVQATQDDEQEHGSDGALLKKRVRSGQMLRHPGHIVIVGDVNPGAQVIAGGDIIVWGKLQGTAHAGAYGNTDAVICALELSPALLKIAELTIRSYKGKTQMARIKDQEIIFSKWDNKT